jgi:drug/metabolite transporter (DMT)-like permease
MHLPLNILAPLTSAALYAFAAMALKRATVLGAGPWRAGFVVNWVQGAIFSLLWFLPGQPFTWVQAGEAALTGFAFFIGQVFTFLALSRGDVSVATPVLGTKVIFVAIFTVVIVRSPIPAVWWWATLITVVATALMGAGGNKTSREAFVRGLTYGFAAAASFALTDVLAQKWATAWGFTRFAPVMFLFVAICSCLMIPRFRGPLSELSPLTWRWLGLGSLFLSMQACGIAYAIMTYGEATMVNILYASRGVWTVALVWIIGHWFGNDERDHGHRIMGQRLFGAGLLLVAVVLVVRGA